MKISIITVAYNAEKYIKYCIESVLSQDYTSIEYIVIDGNSTDKTLAIINGFGERISKIISENDDGIYDALNKGIQHATGDIIGFLHADDFYTDKTIISEIVNAFKRSHADILYGDLDYVDQYDTNKIIRKWRSRSYSRILLNFGWMPAHPTVFLKREVYLKSGNFDTQFKTAADYDLMLRIFKNKSYRKIYIPNVIIKMRVGGQSNLSLKNRWKANREDFKALKKNKLPFAHFIAFIKPLRKIFQYFN